MTHVITCGIWGPRMTKIVGSCAHPRVNVCCYGTDLSLGGVHLSKLSTYSYRTKLATFGDDQQAQSRKRGYTMLIIGQAALEKVTIGRRDKNEGHPDGVPDTFVKKETKSMEGRFRSLTGNFRICTIAHAWLKNGTLCL